MLKRIAVAAVALVMVSTASACGGDDDPNVAVCRDWQAATETLSSDTATDREKVNAVRDAVDAALDNATGDLHKSFELFDKVRNSDDQDQVVDAMQAIAIKCTDLGVNVV